MNTVNTVTQQTRQQKYENINLRNDSSKEVVNQSGIITLDCIVHQCGKPTNH